MPTGNVSSILYQDDTRFAESSPPASLSAVIEGVKSLTSDVGSFDSTISLVMKIRDSFDGYVLWLKDVKTGAPGRRALIDEIYLKKPIVILINKYSFLSKCCAGVLPKLIFVKNSLGHDGDNATLKTLKDSCIELLALQETMLENDFNFIEASSTVNALRYTASF